MRILGIISALLWSAVIAVDHLVAWSHGIEKTFMWAVIMVAQRKGWSPALAAAMYFAPLAAGLVAALVPFTARERR
jgi:hypothetical protein